MRAAVRVCDGVGKAEDLIIVAVVILHYDIDEDLVALPRENDRLGMDDGFVFAELADEFFDAVFVEEGLLPRCITAFVGERNFEAGIEKRQFAQPVGQALEFKFRRDGEDRRIGEERDQRPGNLLVFQFADDFELLRGFPALEAHVIDLSVARDLDLEPIGKRVDALCADAVQATGVFVGALPKFSAGVQIREYQFDGWHLELRMHVDRNTAAVVADGNRAVDVHNDLDLAAIAGEMFVDRIVENLEDAVMEAAFIGVADIHARTFPDGFEALQFVDLSGVVFLILTDSSRVALTLLMVGIFVVGSGGRGGWHERRKHRSESGREQRIISGSKKLPNH